MFFFEGGLTAPPVLLTLTISFPRPVKQLPFAVTWPRQQGLGQEPCNSAVTLSLARAMDLPLAQRLPSLWHDFIHVYGAKAGLRYGRDTNHDD